MDYTLRNYKFMGFSWNTLKVIPKGLFIDHKTLIVLNKLKTDTEKKTAKSDIN